MAIPIRCINHKPHGIFNECGSLLCAIEDNVIYVRCSTCPNSIGNWFKIFLDENDGVIIKKMPKNFKLHLNDEIKMVE